MMNYKPKEYWEKRLNEQFNLIGVGHRDFNENYNRYLYKLKKDVLNIAIERYQISINNNVLDIGSGTGFFIDFYSNFGQKSITGIDITRQSVKNLEEKYPNYVFECHDIGLDNITLSDKYNIINVFDVLYHITDPKKFEIAIDNIGKLSQKGAYIFITDIFGKDDITPADHVYFRRLNIYEELLKKNNIDILDIQPMYHLMNKHFRYIPISVFNYFAPLLYKIDTALNKNRIKSNDIKLLIGRKC